MESATTQADIIKKELGELEGERKEAFNDFLSLLDILTKKNTFQLVEGKNINAVSGGTKLTINTKAYNLLDVFKALKEP